MIEDVIDMLLRGPIARDGVLDEIKAVRILDQTLLWKRKPSCLCDRLLAPAPPFQLPQVCQYDAGRLDIARSGNLRLDILDEVDRRTLVNSSLASDDTMSEDAKILGMFVEEDNDSFLVLEVGGDEDGDMRFGLPCAEGQPNLFKADILETLSYDFADCT